MKLNKSVIVATTGAVLALSGTGVVTLQQVEGVVLTAYPDPATRKHPNPAIRGKPWTICVGRTGRIKIDNIDTEVKPGLTLTIDQCSRLAQEDAEKARAALNVCIKLPKGALTQNQSDALIIWAINIGNHAACTSTAVKRLNERNFNEAALRMTDYKFAAGQPILVKRRAVEYKLFMTPDAPLFQRDTLANMKHANAELMKQ